MRRLSLLLAAIVIVSCSSDKEEGLVVSDLSVLEIAKTVSSFTYYRNSPDTMQSAVSVSPHFAFVRVRFNQVARSVMNDSMTAALSEFPDESMIVKEVYDNRGGPLISYSIMFKKRNAANSTAGWVWNETEANGNVIFSTALKGDRCVGCHGSGDNSDFLKTPFFH
jgi:hypothetical protein